MFDKKDAKKKSMEKNFKNLSNEEKAKLELEQAREQMANLRKELAEDEEAQAFLKAVGSIFGNLGKMASEVNNGNDDDPRNNFNQLGDISRYGQALNGKESLDTYGSVKDKLKDLEPMKYEPLPDYAPMEYEFDHDPTIVGYLFSLDGAGYKKEGRKLVRVKEINPTPLKQWENTSNPLLTYEGTSEFFYKYFEIDKEKDNIRVRFIDEEVKEDEK